jgi:hypothetical protein
MTDSFFSRLFRQVAPPLPAVVEVGPLGVVYGPGTAQELAQAAKGMAAVAVEPEKYPSPPIPHAYAYVPLAGFHGGNQAHRPFLAAVEQADGFLRDATGVALMDPHGPGTTLIDYRKPAVRQVMRLYLSQQAKAGYRGFFFDAIDSLLLAEKLSPSHAGIARAAADFLEESVPELRHAGLAVVVNGGLYTVKGIDLLPIIGRSGAALAAEHQYTDAKGGLRTESDANWTKSRLVVFATAAASVKLPARFYFIEGPVARGELAKYYRDGAAWAQSLLLPIKRRLPQIAIEFGLYFTEDMDYRTLTPLP